MVIYYVVDKGTLLIYYYRGDTHGLLIVGSALRLLLALSPCFCGPVSGGVAAANTIPPSWYWSRGHIGID